MLLGLPHVLSTFFRVQRLALLVEGVGFLGDLLEQGPRRVRVGLFLGRRLGGGLGLLGLQVAELTLARDARVHHHFNGLLGFNSAPSVPTVLASASAALA